MILKRIFSMLFELKCTRQITVDRTRLGRTGTEGVFFSLRRIFLQLFSRERDIYIPSDLFPPCWRYWLFAWLSDG